MLLNQAMGARYQNTMLVRTCSAAYTALVIYRVLCSIHGGAEGGSLHGGTLAQDRRKSMGEILSSASCSVSNECLTGIDAVGEAQHGGICCCLWHTPILFSVSAVHLQVAILLLLAHQGQAQGKAYQLGVLMCIPSP
jgi:hypothetical protein